MLPTVQDEHRSRGSSSAALCFFLMVIFLGTHLFPSTSTGKGKDVNLDSSSESLVKEEVKEKIVYELSLTNEKLEIENRALRQDIMHLKRMYHNCMREHNLSLTMNDDSRVQEDKKLRPAR
ncbi:hypothetical protein CEUSTIGMA_g10920.t1 [Chlamydomonas eustigma]|uniref:Uncharacterized protein n=1 Tax=Chlamydomonas eustigma TaxID=1157962 RepID=A0A250XK83_9CHLO|nr:hypothetical protein CEUSTIGMA_g10920.t1 [Chlamydomonas eustigma]|eukprot:GAX83495.1 hypothetical protein CEUSTIGMA_g10920.t1 [Chlamydomonas eustigma]